MARMRSPNFPGLSLEEAIKAAKSVWDKNRLAPISREAAAKDIGYSGLTGRSLKVLGAMNQYGLIENSSTGQLRVTRLAQEVFVGFPEDVKRRAVTQAGRSPSLYREILDRFEGGIPGENAVRSFLFQKGFTNEGVEKALKSFLETNRFVEINGVPDRQEALGNEPPESPSDEYDADAAEIDADAFVPAVPPKKGKVNFVENGPLDFQLSSTGLAVMGKTNSAATLKLFIAKLTAIAALLPEGEGDE